MGREASRVSFLMCPFCVSVFYVGNAPFRKPRRTRDLRRDRSFRLQQHPSTNASDEHICSDLPLPLLASHAAVRSGGFTTVIVVFALSAPHELEGRRRGGSRRAALLRV
jgi:hypothetical protein